MNRISEVAKVVQKLWWTQPAKNLTQSSLSVRLVAQNKSETAKSTGKSMFPINANFAAELPSGFAGETLTSATTATRDRLPDSISLASPRKNCPNVKEKANVQVVDCTAATANNSVLDAECVVEIGRALDSSDYVFMRGYDIIA